MNQWKPPVIEVIAITGNKYATETQCFGSVILVGVSATASITNGQDICAKLPKNFNRDTRKILICIKSWLSASPRMVIHLPLFSFCRLIVGDDILYICPRHRIGFYYHRRKARPRKISPFLEI